MNSEDQDAIRLWFRDQIVLMHVGAILRPSHTLNRLKPICGRVFPSCHRHKQRPFFHEACWKSSRHT